MILVSSPEVTVESVTPTNISIDWTSGGREGVEYDVIWTYSGTCSGINGGSTSVGGNRSYTIPGLEEYSTYSITVIARNSLGSTVSDAINGTTGESSKT